MRKVIMKGGGYALVWWNQFCREIKEERMRYANTWADLKKEFKSHFVPALYARDLYNRLQRMYQGSKSIEDYHVDIQVTLTRASVLESNKATIACFLHKLNRDIQDTMELYDYAFLDALVHQEIKVEA
ncbi:hypothetical protein CR513_09991, partial [Mucuna pruriens]